eukprot:2290783-Pleurochrysis_carterae.AAC.2
MNKRAHEAMSSRAHAHAHATVHERPRPYSQACITTHLSFGGMLARSDVLTSEFRHSSLLRLEAEQLVSCLAVRAD